MAAPLLKTRAAVWLALLTPYSSLFTIHCLLFTVYRLLFSKVEKIPLANYRMDIRYDENSMNAIENIRKEKD